MASPLYYQNDQNASPPMLASHSYSFYLVAERVQGQGSCLVEHVSL